MASTSSAGFFYQKTHSSEVPANKGRKGGKKGGKKSRDQPAAPHFWRDGDGKKIMRPEPLQPEEARLHGCGLSLRMKPRELNKEEWKPRKPKGPSKDDLERNRENTVVLVHNNDAWTEEGILSAWEGVDWLNETRNGLAVVHFIDAAAAKVAVKAGLSLEGKDMFVTYGERQVHTVSVSEFEESREARSWAEAQEKKAAMREQKQMEKLARAKQPSNLFLLLDDEDEEEDEEDELLVAPLA